MDDLGQIAVALPDPYRILWREKVSSTNDELRELALQGMGAGLVLVADEQTAGRGRRGAEWLSPKGENLAFSVLLRPVESKALWHRLSLATGLAVAEALEKYVPAAEIKWPNDIKVSDNKIAGILVEAGANFVIVGIGINVNSTAFPPSLDATSLCMIRGGEVARSEVILEVITKLSRLAPRIGTGFNEILSGVRERCALTGKRITYLSGGIRKEGLMKGIGAGGELLVETDGTTTALLQADEVRVV